MKTTISLLLALMAGILILSEPTDDAPFLLTLLWSKALGFALAWLSYKVAKSSDRLMERIDKILSLDDED